MKEHIGLGTELKFIRKQHNLTQRGLAAKLGIGQTAVANYETGKRFPDKDMLVKIADIFNVSVDNLLGRSADNKYPTVKTSAGFNYQPSDLGKNRDEFMDKALNSSRKATNMVLALLANGYTEEQILIDLLESALVEAGKRWAEGRYNEAMEHQLSMTSLQSMLLLQAGSASHVKHSRKAVFLTAVGENHNIGLKMLSRFLEIDGWECYFLGSSVPAKTLQEYISASKIDLVCISVTLMENIDSVCSFARALKRLDNPPFLMAGGTAANSNMKILSEAGTDYIHESINQTIAASRELRFKSRTS